MSEPPVVDYRTPRSDGNRVRGYSSLIASVVALLPSVGSLVVWRILGSPDEFEVVVTNSIFISMFLSLLAFLYALHLVGDGKARGFHLAYVGGSISIGALLIVMYLIAG